MKIKTPLFITAAILCWMASPQRTKAQPQCDGYVHDVVQLEDFTAKQQSFALDEMLPRSVSSIHITGTLHSTIAGKEWKSDYIKFAPQNSTSSQGVITTSSLGWAKEVTISWCSNNQPNAAVTIYGNDDPNIPFDKGWEVIETLTASPGQTNTTSLLLNNPKRYLAIIGTGNNAFVSSIDIAWQQTAYERNGMTACLNTLCLPYNATIPAGVRVYEVLGKIMEDTTPVSVVFTPVNEILAGMPYVFASDSEELHMDLGTEFVSVAGNRNGLYGTFEDYPFANDGLYADNNYWIINNSNELQAASVKSGVRANRAFIKMDEVPQLSPAALPAQRLTIGISDGAATSTNCHIYCPQHDVPEDLDLSGRMCKRSADICHGVYVVNGKKIIK